MEVEDIHDFMKPGRNDLSDGWIFVVKEPVRSLVIVVTSQESPFLLGVFGLDIDEKVVIEDFNVFGKKFHA